MISDDIRPGHINLVNHEKSKKIIYEVLHDIASIKSTLGPGGKANLVHDPNDMTVYPNRDGFRLLTGLHYDDYFYDTILKTVRDVSEHNNRKIGDGTTSAAVILEKFYTTLEDYVSNHKEGFKHVSMTGVVNILKTLKVVLREQLISLGYVKFLKEYDLNTQKTIIRKVATVAANNDKTVGDYIAKLFDNLLEKGNAADELFVDIQPNYKNETDENNEIGFRMPCGYIHRVYATERDGVTAIYKNPRYLLIEGPIMEGDISTIEPIIFYTIFELEKPLVIIAGDYVGKAAQYLYSLRIGGSERINPNFNPNKPESDENPKTFILPPMNILPLQYGTGDDTGHERMVDLETALGGKAIPAITEHWEMGKNPKEWENILGRSKSITSIPHDTSITGGGGVTSKIEGRIQKIKEDLDKMVLTDNASSMVREADYRERIGMLNSNMVSIRVGGATFKERKYNTLVYEDAVCAIKSTVKNGFTLAGQVSIQDIIKKHKIEIIQSTINKLNEEGRNVTYGSNRKEALANAISSILDIMSDTFKEAYKNAIENAIPDASERDNIFKTIYESENPVVYNLMKDDYEALDPTNDMFVAGNTDYETIAAVFEITNIFLNTDNLETLYIPRRLSKEEALAMKAQPNSTEKPVQ